jgi:hypothetical protein
MKRILFSFLMLASFFASAQVSDATLTGLNTSLVIQSKYTPVNAGTMHQAIIDSKVSLLGSYANPSWITSLPWSKLTSIPNITGSTGTTNTLSYWSSSDVLGSLPTATYPNLTELATLKGISTGSSIATQLGLKFNTSDFNSTGDARYWKLSGSNTSTSSTNGNGLTLGSQVVSNERTEIKFNSKTDAIFQYVTSGGLADAFISVGSSDLQIIQGQSRGFFLSSSNSTFFDATSLRGLTYGADYNVNGIATYGSRWIPDWGAVNSVAATLTNKTLTSPVINTPTGIVKGDVGLGNVDNTSDATKNAASVTLTNKTIALGSNTVSGTSDQVASLATDPVRTITGTDAIVQPDNGRTLYFDSATPFNFTIDALTINTFTLFRNIGAGTVTFIDGSGVTSTGATELLAGETGGIEYITSTTPIISVAGGSSSGVIINDPITTHVRKSQFAMGHLSGATSGNFGTAVLSSDIANGETVKIEVDWVVKDDTSNTGAGGTFTSVWTKASGTLAKVYDSNYPAAPSNTGDTLALSSSDVSGDINIAIGTGTIGGNFTASAVATVTIIKL